MASRQARPFAPDEQAQRKADPNKRWRWLIPFIIAAQVALKVGMPRGPVPALSKQALLSAVRLLLARRALSSTGVRRISAASTAAR